MRIGIVCPYDVGSPGGVQQLTGELAAELRARGEEVRLVGAGRLAPSGREVEPMLTAVGRSISVRANRSKVPLTLGPASVLDLRAALADVDVVHVHEPLVPLVGWAALSLDKPMVATFHADPPAWVSTFYRMAPFVGRRLRRAALTAVSPTAAQAIPQSWGPVEVIPNAIDVGSYRLPVGKVRNRVAFLGRDEPRKGLDVLLEAWPFIRAAVPGAELKVLGAERDSPPDGVELLGRISGGEKKRMLATSSVFVAPNTGGESFGIVVLEAMAAGCAVVTSDIPAFVSVLGDSGLTFPNRDRVALADRVIGLLQESERIDELRALAAARIELFDWGVVAERYRASYLRVAS